MTNNYLCKKCLFKTNHFNDLRRHLNKKKPCEKRLESYNYSDDQLIILSLIPCNESNIDIDHLKNSNIIFKNKDKLFSAIDFIEKNKLKKCVYCSSEFNKISDLRKHVLTNCFYNELLDEINLKQKEDNNLLSNNLTNSLNTVSTINNNNNNIANSAETINNNCTNNNITNIYFEIKQPVPFDGEWDISKIDQIYKERIIFSNFMYTKLLEEILNNEINLNVIIDKNNDSGIVYKNDIDKYIQMKSKDIVDNTMEKLKKHLIEINDASQSTSILECLKISKHNIELKHDTYKNNQKIQENVKNLISKIFEEKKDDALNISNAIQTRDLENIEQGF
jgi:hypothetical protein